ncbi:MAG: NAD(+) diphosphatase [Lachnospiraceae bacterium]|uniref:NAD(+) diphosphatase n=1 Tax=Candidatus Weimeria bifida TaxID=2599074 RepID=A0A6N7IZU2_9FIRM|nr:NAD(+) diphosphatase [Candidatus Weimeria bifida]RRF97238.1 MAG: NAD(+) diphosphatase [Lachnospiraceae bacterium]
MIQDIFPDKLYNQYDPSIKPVSDSKIYVFRKDSLLVKKGDFQLPDYSDFSEYLAGHEGAQVIFLFKINDDRRFLLLPPAGPGGDEFSDDDVAELAGEFSYKKMFDLRWDKSCGRTEIFAITVAYQLNVWYKNNRFCGRDQTPLQLSAAERALVCPKCGFTRYPRINPAVIVGVIDPAHDRLLLSKYRGRAEVPFYALLAGFCEIGEAFEDTVRREVMEETGLSVKNIRYYKSQPWGRAGDILAGYFCDVDGSTEIKIEEDELALAEWFERKEVSGQPDNLSLTNEMMLIYRDGKEPK